MFTGIIEETGSVEAIEPRAAGARLRIRCATVVSDAREGDSICVSGVCLTALDIRKDGFSADLAPETLARSTLSLLRTGEAVNLERSLAANGRLGGHIVQGHVDGIGEVVRFEPLGDGNWWLTLRIPEEMQRYVVFKGSIAIDGISLTIAAVEGDLLSVTIIPHTYEATAMRRYRTGTKVNLETDVIAKYVEKMLGLIERPASLTVEKLKEQGY
jgi:riboflavin synthase